MSVLRKIISKLEGSHDVVFMSLIVICAIFVKIPMSALGDYLTELLGLKHTLFFSRQQIPEIGFKEFVIAVILAPSLETLVGQFLPIEAVGRYSKSTVLKIVISSLVFSAFHLPVLGFLFSAFAIGVFFGWAYIVKARENRLKAFLFVSTAHGIHNFIAFMLVFAFRDYFV